MTIPKNARVAKPEKKPANNYVFKIKRQHPLTRKQNDDLLFLDIPDCKFAEEIAKRIPKLIARYKKLEKEGVKDRALQFIFTGNLAEGG